MLTIALLVAASAPAQAPSAPSASSRPFFPGRLHATATQGELVDLVAVDLDRDGHLDLVGMHEGAATTVSALLGDGRGALRLSGTNSAPGWCWAGALAVLDVDGDGRLDAVTSGSLLPGGGALLAFPGDGAGGLGAPSRVALSARAGRLAVADMDRDGLDDLVAATATGLSVLLRDPAGGLAPEATYSDVAPTSIGVRDLDGDLYPDVLVDRGGAQVRMWRNAGDGSLLSPVDVPQTAGTIQIALGDLDGDARTDLVCTGFTVLGRLVLTAHLGDGQGGFARAAELELENAGLAGLGALLGGRMESILVRQGSFVRGVALRGGRLVAQGPFLGSPSARCFALADLDEDGHADWIAARRQDDLRAALAVFPGAGDGSLRGVVVSPSRGGGGAQAFCDLDGDGLLDALGGDSGRAELLFHRGRPGARFDPARVHALTGNLLHVLPGDLDGDGDLDVALLCHQPYAIQLLLGDGSGALASSGTLGLAGYSLQAGGGLPIAGDVDGDGRTEVVLTAATSGRTAVLGADAGGGPRVEALLATPGAIGPLIARDVVGGSAQDILYLRRGPGSVAELWVLASDGAGGWGPPAAWLQLPLPWMPGRGGRPWTDCLFVCDLEGDGLPDVLATRAFVQVPSWPIPTATQLGVWRGAGGGWTNAEVRRLDGLTGGTGPLDLDSDGAAEIALFAGNQQPGALGASLTIRRSVGDSLAAVPDRYATWASPLADLDRDGRPDIVQATPDGLITFLNLSARAP